MLPTTSADGPVLRAAVAGWGHAVPRDDVRTTAQLAVEASVVAIRSAGITPAELSLVIVATSSPEQPIPETSAFVADGLDVHCGAFDIGAAWAGFPYALLVASAMLGANRPPGGPVLVVGADNLTSSPEPANPLTAGPAAEAAGAFVLASSGGGHDGPGILAFDTGSNGSHTSLAQIRAGGSRRPLTVDAIAAGEHRLKLQATALLPLAFQAITDSSWSTLKKAGRIGHDVNAFLSNLPGARLDRFAAARLGIPEDRCLTSPSRPGGLSAASIPLRLSEAATRGHLSTGDLILISGFGAGLTWASVLLRWGMPGDFPGMRPGFLARDTST